MPEESPFPSHAQATKINRLPANLLDQFEKQLPSIAMALTLSSPAGGQGRGESWPHPPPGPFVQRLFFTKAPSLEGTAGRLVAMVAGRPGGPKQGAGRGQEQGAGQAGGPSAPWPLPASQAGGAPMTAWMVKVSSCATRPSLGGFGGAWPPGRAQPAPLFHTAYNTISGHMLKPCKNTTTELTAHATPAHPGTLPQCPGWAPTPTMSSGAPGPL